MEITNYKGKDYLKDDNDEIKLRNLKNPKYIDYREMAVNALQKMNDLKITCMPVTDESGKVVGAILMQDILKAGIVR